MSRGKKRGPVTTLPARISAAVAPSPKDAWAFGATSAVTPYAAHYNNGKLSRWRSLSPAYIWVVGYPVATSQDPFAIELFNGKKWRTAPLPNLGLTATQTAITTGIAGANPKNGWADGIIVSDQGDAKPPLRPFLLHWNGTRWSTGPVPRSACCPRRSPWR